MTVAIIGAGLGGLSAAIHAASKGYAVEVFETMSGPGGKAGIVVLDGVEVDTGPSVLTMPEVFQELWSLAPRPEEVRVPLRREGGDFLYSFPDGTSLRVAHRLDETLGEVERTLGPRARRELADFAAYAARIWAEAAPHFVMGSAPSMRMILGLGVGGLSAVSKIDPMRSMLDAIHKHVREPKLRDIFSRYATYNGSDVRKAPATLNCIAHVELGVGGFGVLGGLQAMVRSLVRTAEQLGVRFHFDTPVRGLLQKSRVVRGLRTDEGEFPAQAVIANCDANHLRCWVDIPKAKGERPSMSGVNLIVKARRREDRPAHQVFFPERYLSEFEDIFDRDRPPEDPTVYVCASEKAHGRTGWDDHEPLFVMANAPAETQDSRDSRIYAALIERMLERLRTHGAIDAEDEVVWKRTPTELAAAFPDTGGAIYGAASNSMWSAFQRPSNRVKHVRNLYLASGSAHPGGGMPLAVLSGREAVRCLSDDIVPSSPR